MVNSVLIICADTAHAAFLENALGDSDTMSFSTEIATQLSDSLERITTGGIDAILLDLSLPDSQGVATFDEVFGKAPHTPIIVFSEPGEELLALNTVQRGAHRCLPKKGISSEIIIKSLHQIFQEKAIEERLFIEKSRAQITLNSISDAVISTDTLGNIDYLNLAAEQITGWPLTDASGLPIQEVLKIINGTTREADQNPVYQVLKTEAPVELNAGTILIRRDGSEVVIEDSASPIHDSAGRLCGSVIVFHDISRSQAMTERMAFLAQHDYLTNLPNRVLLNDRIQHAIEISARHGTTLSVLFLDLDNFKVINDTLGHEVGDKLLRSAASRISDCLRSSDTVSRLGGDEFVLLIQDYNQSETATIIAEKILNTLANPHLIDEHILRVTTSIGISTYPQHGRDADTLIKNADQAMYEAKEKGRNNYQFCSERTKRCSENPVTMSSSDKAPRTRKSPL